MNDGGQDQQVAAVSGSPLQLSDTHNALTPQDQQNSPNNNATTPTIADSVNSSDVVESLKGRIIATNKLLKLVEATKAKTEHDKIKISNLTKQLDNCMAENAKLQKQIAAVEAAKKDLEKKQTMASGSDYKSKSDKLQRDLEQALEQKKQKENLLSSREMYTKQLEAQLEDLESKLSGRNKEPKKKEDNTAILEKKDRQIKELKDQLDSALKEQELAEEDKMEMSITNEMLQRDHDELKEQLEKQQQDQATASINHQQQQQALQKKLQQLQSQLQNTKLSNTDDATRDELELVRQKLRHSHTRIMQLESEVTRISRMEQSNQMVQQSSSIQNTDYTELVAEFRKCLAENETMKREKRVLQDKLTEQLLINDEIKTSKRNTILSQHGINTSALMDSRDLYNSNIDFEEIEYASRSPTTLTLERHTSRHRSPSEETTFDRFSPTMDQQGHRRSSFNTPEQPKTRSASSSLLHSPHSTIPEHPTLRIKTRTATTPIAPISKPTGRRLVETDPRTTYGANGLVIPQSQIDRPAPSLQARKPKLTALEKRIGVRRPLGFGITATTTKEKRKPETPLTPRKKRVIFDSDSDSTDSDLGSATPSISELAAGKRRLPPKATPKIPPKPEEFVKLQAEQFAHMLPADTQQFLEGMKTYVESHLELFLASLETIYQRMKTHSVSIPKNDAGSMEQIGAETLVTLEGCPKNIDWKEKNVAWSLWALVTQNRQVDLYSKVIKWASENTLKFMGQAKVNLACRYIRLFMLLCKNAKDKPRVSVFCYDLIRWSPRHANIIPPVVNIALIWPDVLDLSDETRETVGTNMIIKTIQRTCAHYCKGDKSPENVKSVYDTMTRLAHWPELNQAKTLEDYTVELKTVLTLPDFKLLYNANKDAFNDLRINLLKSFELSYWRMDDWTAIYDGFITKDLWDLMSDEVLSHVSLELMGLLARCGIQAGPDNAGITILRQTFKTILETGNNCLDDEFPLQVIAAKCLMMISKDNMANIKPVFQWHSQLKQSFLEKLPTDFDQGIHKLRPLSM